MSSRKQFMRSRCQLQIDQVFLCLKSSVSQQGLLADKTGDNNFNVRQSYGRLTSSMQETKMLRRKPQMLKKSGIFMRTSKPRQRACNTNSISITKATLTKETNELPGESSSESSMCESSKECGKATWRNWRERRGAYTHCSQLNECLTLPTPAL